MRQVDPGNIVHATDANGIVTITQEQPINIVFAVPEIDLSQVLKARAINPDLTVEAWDRDSKNKRNSQRRKTSCVCPGRHDWRGRRPEKAALNLGAAGIETGSHGDENRAALHLPS